MQRLKYVDPNYQHHAKVVTPRAPLDLGGVRLKWYDIARQETPVAEPVQQLAIEFLKTQSQSPTSELESELGFVMLHRCGTDFYFLIVCTWRGSNELWQTVFAKESDQAPQFSLFPRERAHKPTYCVWEMAAVTHETQSWSRFLRTSRDAIAERTYLEDTFSGVV